MMPATKTPVTISVSSIQTDGDEREVTNRAHAGHMYEREDGLYLLYDDDEGNHTTVRVAGDVVRIYRRGLVNSWQDFQQGEMTGGLLAVGENENESGEMVLRVKTTELTVVRDPARGQLKLAYDLFTGQSAASDADDISIELGHFTLEIVWDALEP